MFPLLPRRDSRNVVQGSSGRGRQGASGGARPGLQLPSAIAHRHSQSERILVVSLDNLGDLVFASALTPMLRARYPDAEITLWCKRYTAPIGTLLPGVDRVENADPFWDRAPGRQRGAVLPFVQSVLRLRNHNFDLAVLAAAPWRTAAAVAATGAECRIGLSRNRNERWLTHTLSPEDPAQPVLREMGRLLEPLGIPIPAEMRYQLDPERLSARREQFRPLLGARPVALHPFARNRAQCVPLKQWIRVAVELARRGHDPLWIGTADELREVHRAVGSAAWKYVDKLGDGTLADATAALSLAHLFVGHDSGPMHVAGAFGVPVVGVFTPGAPTRTFPQGLGESRMLVRADAASVTCDDILDVVDELPNAPPLRLMR